MSHTMNIKTEIRDQEALKAACERLGANLAGEGSFAIYKSREDGIGVYLPDWKYPVVIKEDGTLAYDDYDGQWGNLAGLHGLLDAYGLEKAAMEARRQGYSVFETADEQGYLQLHIGVRD